MTRNNPILLPFTLSGASGGIANAKLRPKKPVVVGE